MQTEIDEKLLEEVRKLAERQGRSEREILDEAVNRHLERNRAGGLEGLFERGVEPLSDEEAERLRGTPRDAARANGGEVIRAVLDPGVLVSAALAEEDEILPATPPTTTTIS